MAIHWRPMGSHYTKSVMQKSFSCHGVIIKDESIRASKGVSFHWPHDCLGVHRIPTNCNYIGPSNVESVSMLLRHHEEWPSSFIISPVVFLWFIFFRKLGSLWFNTLRLRRNWHFETKLTFRRRHFETYFLQWKLFEFRLKCHWSLFLRVQLTIFQYWFR